MASSDAAAHELGHLVLHLDGDAFDTAERDEEEREADVFGSHLLMPEALFGREWDDTAGHALLDRVLKLKRIFRVSYKTVLHRLVESGRAERTVWRTFQQQHQRRFGTTLRKVDEPERMTESDFGWNRADEPERLSPSDFIEDRLHRLVREAFEQGLISLGRTAELLRVDREEARQLARDWLD
jgi:Zn-dependent peptidase ImmA (M78 family)